MPVTMGSAAALPIHARYLKKMAGPKQGMKGSHRQFKHSTKVGTVTVAGKPSIEIPPGTLSSILKQAGLK